MDRSDFDSSHFGSSGLPASNHYRTTNVKGGVPWAAAMLLRHGMHAEPARSSGAGALPSVLAAQYRRLDPGAPWEAVIDAAQAALARAENENVAGNMCPDQGTLCLSDQY